jgi:acetate kinase
MTKALLVLNAGSSSIKFAVYAAGTLQSLLHGTIDALGKAPHLRVAGQMAGPFSGAHPPPGSHEIAVAWLLDRLADLTNLQIAGAGHRVVHGGRQFAEPVLLDDAAIAAIDRLTPLAPGHQPHNLAAIRAVAQHWPHLPQIACFDTSFHRTQPILAQTFAIPRSYTEEGLLHYGFHGLSYQYIASVLPAIAGTKAEGRVIVGHLGHGASLCAMHARKSVATTMGLTALDGLMMGTRCGAIDPGLVLHLIRERGMSAEAVEDVLSNRSGLVGVSGISDDVRELEASTDPAARQALDLFAYRCIGEMGSLIALLGGLDVLVFTAGIGENSASIRQSISDGFGWLGLRLDPSANGKSAQRISAADSTIEVFVVPTDEEIVIAQAVSSLLGLGAKG